MENESIETSPARYNPLSFLEGGGERAQERRLFPRKVSPKGEKEERRRRGELKKVARKDGGLVEGVKERRGRGLVGVMQEQKAENTGRQFCSCFYQLLGIGGSGSTMPGRILGGSCGNVRLFSVPPPPLPLPLFLLFILVRSRIPPPLSHPDSAPGFLRLAFLFPPLADSAPATCSSPVRLARPSSSLSPSPVLPSCLGYQGSSRSPSTVHSATWCALYLRTVRAP